MFSWLFYGVESNLVQLSQRSQHESNLFKVFVILRHLTQYHPHTFWPCETSPLVRNMILVNRLALTCFYVGFQFETKTDQSSYVPKIFYELILIIGSFVDSLLGCHWMKLLSTPDTSLERSTHLFLRGFLV